MGKSSILVPAYIYPSSNAWGQYTSSFPACSVLIANASSGPGNSQNSDYVTAINNARTAGLQVIGYVDTNYTAVSTATAEANVDSWYSFYAMDGIFFDRVDASVGASFTYYQTLYNYVKAKDATRNFVGMNPGTTPAESYMTISDTITILENSYAAWQGASPYAGWMANYSASKLAMLVYSIPDANGVLAVINQAKGHNVGRFFLTNQSGYTATPGSTVWNASRYSVRGQLRTGSYRALGRLLPI